MRSGRRIFVPRPSPARAYCDPPNGGFPMSKLQRIGLFFLSPILIAGLVFWTAPAGEKTAGSIVTLKGHKEEIYSVAFTPDGKFLATGSFDNTIKLWDVAAAKEIRTFGGVAGHKDM